MPVYVNKPEFALKRAEEFLDVGKRTRALEALTEAIKNRKNRIWQKSHEEIMKKFLYLCVELKQSQTAKEGLHQYKNLTANVNPKSLEDVVRYYLSMSEAKSEEAREKSNVQATAPVVDVDDLDLAESPEGMLLKAVSTDTVQDRSDRVVLLPWVRFNWEAYRHCLDLLRNLSKLEALYHDIAAQAFRFCMKYQRKTELRKLSEMLRNHIGQISKREIVTPNSVNLNNPETQELNLRTRLVQLDHAIAMEMWQEAFRAIEDVHNFMSMLKKVPKAALKANYFEKLGLVFLRAGNAVFHAAAQHQLFNMYRNYRKDLNTEELRKLAVAVLFATLAVPLQPPRTQLEALLEYDESAASKMKQLTTLVGFQQAPTRAKLVEDLNRLGVLHVVKPELQRLYRVMESSFDPLHMGAEIAEVLNAVSSDPELEYVKHYVKAIEEVAVGKQLRQLAQAFDSVQIRRVADLMPYTDWHTIERVAVETARNTDLEIRIDHRDSGLFVFGSEVALAPYEDKTSEGKDDSQIPTDRVRSQLVVLLTSLTKTHRLTKSKDAVEEEGESRKQLFNLYRKNAQREHLSNLQRAAKIENRQRLIEERERAREHRVIEKKRIRDRETEVADSVKADENRRQLEEQRALLKLKEIERNKIREKIEKMQSTEFGLRVLNQLSEADRENMTFEQLTELEDQQRREMRKEEEEKQARLVVKEKNIDYFIRAKHLEEVPLRVEYNAKIIQDFKDKWAEDERHRIELERERHENNVKKRERMMRMQEQYNTFRSSIQDRNRQAYDEALIKWKKTVESEKVARLAARRKEREETRKREWEAWREEQKRKREEEEQRLQEDKEKEEKRRVEEERERKYRETQEKQRAKEREIEEREAAKNRELQEKLARERGAVAQDRPGASQGGSRYVPPAARGAAPVPETGDGGSRYMPPGARGAAPVPDAGTGPRARNLDTMNERPQGYQRREEPSAWRSSDAPSDGQPQDRRFDRDRDGGGRNFGQDRDQGGRNFGENRDQSGYNQSRGYGPRDGRDQDGRRDGRDQDGRPPMRRDQEFRRPGAQNTEIQEGSWRRN